MAGKSATNLELAHQRMLPYCVGHVEGHCAREEGRADADVVAAHINILADGLDVTLVAVVGLSDN